MKVNYVCFIRRPKLPTNTMLFPHSTISVFEMLIHNFQVATFFQTDQSHFQMINLTRPEKFESRHHFDFSQDESMGNGGASD